MNPITANPQPKSTPKGISPVAGVKRLDTPMTPSQQLEALRRLQDQAEQRVKLGVELFRAAEAHTTYQDDLLAKIRSQQDRLVEELGTVAGRHEKFRYETSENIDAAMACLTGLRKVSERLEQGQQRLETQLESVGEKVQSLEATTTQGFDQIRQWLTEVWLRTGEANSSSAPNEAGGDVEVSSQDRSSDIMQDDPVASSPTTAAVGGEGGGPASEADASSLSGRAKSGDPLAPDVSGGSPPVPSIYYNALQRLNAATQRRRDERSSLSGSSSLQPPPPDSPPELPPESSPELKPDVAAESRQQSPPDSPPDSRPERSGD